MDLYSRSIISWVLTKTMDADEVLKCIEKAKEMIDSGKAYAKLQEFVKATQEA